MSAISNIIIIISFIWLIALTICLALFYRDYILFKFTDQAKEITKGKKKRFVIPGSGVFTLREKRKALVNDDSKAYELENDGN